MKPKTISITYWILLILFSLGILPSAIPSVLALDYAVDHFQNHLGYPVYFLYFTGVTKLLGIIALYIPGYPRIKEWVYAGFVFDLVGAMYSAISVGDPFVQWVAVLIDFIILVLLYGFHHKRLAVNRTIEHTEPAI